jgi:Flp pilus assembly protein TadD
MRPGTVRTSALDRAMALHRAGDLGQALTAYQDLLAADPGNADALHLTGVLAHQMGRTSVGIACIEQAIQLNPAAPLYHRNMAELRKSTGDHARAAVHLLQAVALNPGDAPAHVELGLMQATGGGFSAAIASYQAAIAIDPALVGAHTNLGVALEAIGDDEGAEAAYRQALAFNAEFAPALNNLGAFLGAQELVEPGIALLRRAITADPGHVEARVNLGHLLLLVGEVREGWTQLEARRLVRNALHPPAGARDWTGSGDPCRRLLVCAEQGLGDELMFASCLADLQAAQPQTTLVLECDPRLAPLFARSFPGCEIRPYRLTPSRLRSSRRDWLAQAPVDAYVPAGTLPLHFRSDPASYPRTAGYLVADPRRVDHWRAWLARAAGGRRTVGLCWRSGTGGGTRDSLALPLPAWDPLLADSRLSVVNLQYGAAGPALVAHARAIGAPVLEPPELDLFDDLDDIAALMSALDQVVSAPTSVCELAGAIGRPTWRVMRGNDWSLLGASGTRPWHPNTRMVIGPRRTEPAALIGELLTKMGGD